MKKIIILCLLSATIETSVYANMNENTSVVSNRIETKDGSQHLVENIKSTTDTILNNASKFIETVTTNLDKKPHDTVAIENNSNAKLVLKSNVVTITQEESKAIAEAESKAIAEAEAIRTKLIAEAEAKKTKAIAEAVKAKSFAEIEATKVKIIAEAEAKAIAETKITKSKVEAIKLKAINDAEIVKAKAEAIYKNETHDADTEINAILKAEKRKNKKNSVLKQTVDQAKISIGTLLKKHRIAFNTNKDSLTKQGINTVKKLADILKKYPSVQIEISGHTDSDGSSIFNHKLSQYRVNAVKKLLVLESISSERLLAKGYGESKPIVANTSSKNKQKNRRVEIHIIEN